MGLNERTPVIVGVGQYKQQLEDVLKAEEQQKLEEELRLKEKEIKIKEEKLRIESERLIKKDEELILSLIHITEPTRP